MKKLFKQDKKKFYFISITALLLLIAIGAVTYAWFVMEIDNTKISNLDIGLTDLDRLVFNIDKPLSLMATPNVLDENGDNYSVTSTATATLHIADGNDNGTYYYDVLFNIDTNTMEYTSESTPEIILSVFYQEGNSTLSPITSISGLTYGTYSGVNEDVSGFDITTKVGEFNIKNKQVISASNETDTIQKYIFTITYLNKNYDQSANFGNSISTEIVLQKTDEPENAIAYVVGNDLTITVDKAIDNFTGLLLDGSVVSTDNYTATSGSTIVTLRSSYLETLDQGPHILTFEYTSGNINRTISIPYTYDTAEEHTLTIEKSGYYKLEVWGAQGGSGLSSYTIAGYGGYSVGIVYLSQNESLFINVGGQGQTGYRNSSKNGGYNGGGSGWDNAANDALRSGGGGATHISTVTGLLSSLEAYKNTGNSQNTSSYYVSDEILIVAGGGGGDSLYNSSQYGRNGDGGGYIGINGTGTGAGGGGGTQISGGESSISNTFGTGENAIFGKGADALAGVSSYGGSGGGGGFYGGGHSYNNANGGGGSGYIASSRLTSGGTVTKHMATYGATGNYLSNDTETKTIAATSVSETATADYAKIGDGYARITYCGDSADSCD